MQAVVMWMRIWPSAQGLSSNPDTYRNHQEPEHQSRSHPLLYHDHGDRGVDMLIRPSQRPPFGTSTRPFIPVNGGWAGSSPHSPQMYEPASPVGYGSGPAPAPAPPPNPRAGPFSPTIMPHRMVSLQAVFDKPRACAGLWLR
jgi:hypothetical protein